MKQDYFDRFFDAAQLVIWFLGREPEFAALLASAMVVFVVGAWVTLRHIFHGLIFFARMVWHMVKPAAKISSKCSSQEVAFETISQAQAGFLTPGTLVVVSGFVFVYTHLAEFWPIGVETSLSDKGHLPHHFLSKEQALETKNVELSKLVTIQGEHDTHPAIYLVHYVKSAKTRVCEWVADIKP